MVTYIKKALIALSMVGSVTIYASEDSNNHGFTRNVVTGRGNVITKHYGPGTIHHYYNHNGNGYSEVFTCGQILEDKADGFKITNIDCATPASDIKTKKVQLTGNRKRVPLNEAIDTISIAPHFGEVIINDRDSYIECDEAVFDSGLKFRAMNGRLSNKFKKNSSVEFKGTGGKLLCSIYAKLLNGSLNAEHSSRVKINTPKIRAINAQHSSVISADEKVTLDQLNLLSAQHSSKVDLPNVSVPALTSEVLHSSNVTMAGKATQHNLTVQHSSSFDGSKLKSKYINIDAAHGSKTKLWVTKMLQGFAEFHARILYKGGAQNKVSTSWGATCERDNK